MSERSISKPPKFVRGVLNFNALCSGCRERINKASGNYCHSCEGGHDVHTHHQAVSLLHKRSHDRTVKMSGKRNGDFE